MLRTYRQHCFSGGRLDKELMGRQDVEAYYKGCSELKNFEVKASGCLAKRRGSDLILANFVDEWNDEDCRIIPIVTNAENGFYIIFDNEYMMVASRNRGVLRFKDAYDPEAETPTTSKLDWVSGELTDTDKDQLMRVDSTLGEFDHRKMDWCQCGDEIYITCAEHRPVKVTVTYSDGGSTSVSEKPLLTVANVDVNQEKYQKPEISGATASGWDSETEYSGHKTVKYRCVYEDSDGVESFASEPFAVTYQTPWPEGGVVKVTATCTGYPSLPYADRQKFKRVNFFKNEGSGYGYVGSTDEITYSGVVEWTDTYVTPDLTTTPRDEDSLPDLTSTADKYPHHVCLYGQRLAYASSNEEPFTIWMSRIGHLNDFSTHESVVSEDAITCTLAASEMPVINHLFYAKDLVVFTDGGEWIVNAASGKTVTPESVQAKLHQARGANQRNRPLMIGNEVVFTDLSGERVMTTLYDYMDDGYSVSDASELSHWIFSENAVVEMAYRKTPDSILYCRLADGEVALLTYQKDQKMCAWSRMTFADGVGCLGLASNKSVVDETDTEMMLVAETPHGVELWSERKKAEVEDGDAIDGMLCMDGMRTVSPTSATGALAVPDGMIAVVRATGEVLESGSEIGVGVTVFEGYRITSKLVTYYPDAKGEGGRGTGEIHNPTMASVRVLHGSDFRVGQNAVAEGRDRTFACGPAITQSGTGSATAAFTTGIVRNTLAGSNRRDSRIRLVHDTPWPIRVLGVDVTYQFEPSDGSGQ